MLVYINECYTKKSLISIKSAWSDSAKHVTHFLTKIAKMHLMYLVFFLVKITRII